MCETVCSVVPGVGSILFREMCATVFNICGILWNTAFCYILWNTAFVGVSATVFNI